MSSGFRSSHAQWLRPFVSASGRKPNAHRSNKHMGGDVYSLSTGRFTGEIKRKNKLHFVHRSWHWTIRVFHPDSGIFAGLVFYSGFNRCRWAKPIGIKSAFTEENASL